LIIEKRLKTQDERECGFLLPAFAGTGCGGYAAFAGIAGKKCRNQISKIKIIWIACLIAVFFVAQHVEPTGILLILR